MRAQLLLLSRCHGPRKAGHPVSNVRAITPSYRPKLLCLLDRPPARATTAKKVD